MVNFQQFYYQHVNESVSPRGYYRVSTDVVNQIKELRAQGLSIHQIAEKLNLASSTVLSYLKKDNFTPIKRFKYDRSEIVSKIIALRNNDKSLGEISKLTNINKNTVYQILKKYDTNYKTKAKPYEPTRGYAQITPELTNSIKNDYYSSDITTADIAKKYNIEIGTIYKLIKKHNWKLRCKTVAAVMDQIKNKDTLLNYVGTNFSTFDFKNLNRVDEFNALLPYYNALPFVSNILSFPYEFKFETYLKTKLPYKHFNIYMVEKNKPIKWIVDEIIKFKSKFQDCKVFIPLKKYVSGGPNQLARRVSLAQVTYQNIYFRWANINLERKIESTSIPYHFHIADLDYVNTLTPSNSNEILHVWNKMASGGIMLITLAHNDRSLNTVLKAARTKMAQSGETHKNISAIIDPYKMKSRINNTIKPLFTPSDESLQKFGLNPNNKNFLKHINYIANTLTLKLNNKPVYINTYRGGRSSRGIIMFRFAFIKP